jgi:hypothetical protein
VAVLATSSGASGIAGGVFACSTPLQAISSAARTASSDPISICFMVISLAKWPDTPGCLKPAHPDASDVMRRALLLAPPRHEI